MKTIKAPIGSELTIRKIGGGQLQTTSKSIIIKNRYKSNSRRKNVNREKCYLSSMALGTLITYI
jgi:hypothetical protein